MNTMLKLLLLGAVSVGGTSLSAYAQQPADAGPAATEPIFLLNSTTVVNGLVSDFNPAEIQQIRVYKPDQRSTNDSLPAWQTTLGTGVVVLESKRRVPAESLRAIGRRLKLAGPLQFALNGHWLSTDVAAKLHVASAAIAQLHVTYPTTGQPAARVDIWLKQMPERERAPGAVFIR